MDKQILADLTGLDGLTDSQRQIIEHALGPDRGAHRNHFVTGPGSSDYDNCVELVRRGFMTRTPGNPLTGGDDLFRVTDFARKALLLEGIEEALAVVALVRQLPTWPDEVEEIDEEVWVLLKQDIAEALQRFDKARKSKHA